MIVLGFDAAWGGTGICLADEKGPIAVGHFGLGVAWREARLQKLLDGELEEWFHKAVELAGLNKPRLVIELPPAVYSRGNQSVIGFGMGQLHGIIKQAGIREDFEYPWSIPVADWRKWWGISGSNSRENQKRFAVMLVKGKGWGNMLAPYGTKFDGPLGDVAESILIAVGAAKHEHLAPKGPSKQADPIEILSPCRLN